MIPSSFEDNLRSSFLNQISQLHICLPCKVLSVDKLDQQRIDVQPVINRKFRSGRVEEYAPILAVPVIFPASSTSSFTFPIAVGDTVLCVFSQRGMDAFKVGSGDFAEPTDFRMFSARDAVALPGLFPFGNAVNAQKNRSLPHSTADAVLTHNIGTAAEVEIRFKPDGSLLIKSPTTITVECEHAVVNVATQLTVTSPNTEWSGNISLTGNILQTGNLTQIGTFSLNGINMNDHVHGGVQTGLGTTQGPQ